MVPRWNPKFKCLQQCPTSPVGMASKQVQTFGIPGWISLAPGPTVQWIPREGVSEEIQVVIDERMCCSTLFRVERLSKTQFVIADMLYLNGKHVWATHSFAQRSAWIVQLLNELHTKELCEFVHKSELENVVARGWEYYSSAAGVQGTYVPLPPMVPTKWNPTDNPDVWTNSAGKTLQVSSLDMLKRLRKNPVLQSRTRDGITEILV